jgi:hypothetical protein
MARPRKIPEGIVVEIKEPLLSRLNDFHRASNLPGTVQETARELVEAALSGGGQDALVHAARRRAYKQTANSAWRAYSGLAAQLQDVFRVALATEEANK